jgi:hypothetical protein
MLSTNGKISSKRLITFVAFILMGTGFIANLFWDETIDQDIYESMRWIVLGGLGFTASEKFAKKQTDTTPPIDDTEIDEKLQ